MAFDNGARNATGGHIQAPDFVSSLETYNKRVAELGGQIKAAEAELSEALVALEKAKNQLQEQYAKKVTDLGDEITVLTAQLAILQGQSDTLDKQIQDKRDASDHISLDNSAKQKEIDAEWDKLRASANDVLVGQQKIDDTAKIVAADIDKLEADKKVFEKYKNEQLSLISQKAQEAANLLATATSKMNTAEVTLIEAKNTLAKIDEAKLDLAKKEAEAQGVIDQAEAVQKKSDEADEKLRIASATAFQNQKDVNEIKVARLALNNLKQELDARQSMIDAAEQKL
jgi:chromosome segregation ATPase